MGEEKKQPSIVSYLGKAWFWIFLVGLLAVIGGAFQVLTIVGILWAWLPIWMGILLIQAGLAAKKANETNELTQAELAVKKIATYFKIAGIVAIVFIVLGIISSIVIASLDLNIIDLLIQSQTQLQ